MNDDIVTADVELAIGKRKLQARISVPVAPTPLSQVLPIVRNITDAMTTAACEDAQTLGMPVTFKAGCGACCRQLVPITDVEARRLLAVVEAMPEPRRAQILARFVAAQERLHQAGMLEELRHPSTWTEGEQDPQVRGMDYFQLGIACPFLEDESCSIYAERPLVCREYMVVSPPDHCTSPRANAVKVVHLPLNTRRALAKTSAREKGEALQWVPLILALEWAEAHPDKLPQLSGPDLLRLLFEELTGKEIPPSPSRETPCPPAN